MNDQSAADIIQTLQLEKHPLEGGYFRRTYQSRHIYRNSDDAGQRFCASAIYYLLSMDDPIGYMHRNLSDIVHCYQLGDPTEFTLIKEDGAMQRVVLGPDLGSGHCLQLCVPGGVWKASRLLGQRYSLISELVVPGFDYADNQLAQMNEFRLRYAQIFPHIQDLIKPA